MKEATKEWIKSILMTSLIMTGIMFFARPTVVKGLSMSPTLDDNDLLVVSKVAYGISWEPKRGDVVVFKSKEPMEKDLLGRNKNYIKRIIAIAGDHVAIKDGTVYVNGTALQEDYVLPVKDTLSSDMELVVPEGKVFVMGDNRNGSKDSRSTEVGPVDYHTIIGKAYFRLYPLSKLGPIE